MPAPISPTSTERNGVVEGSASFIAGPLQVESSPKDQCTS
jgi:hypothetical protein